MRCGGTEPRQSRSSEAKIVVDESYMQLDLVDSTQTIQSTIASLMIHEGRAVWLTISRHHGIAFPPLSSRVQSLLGTSGWPVSANSANQLPQKPESGRKPQPWARASSTVVAWQLDVTARQQTRTRFVSAVHLKSHFKAKVVATGRQPAGRETRQ